MPIYIVDITMIGIDSELSYLGPRTFQGNTQTACDIDLNPFTEFV